MTEKIILPAERIFDYREILQEPEEHLYNVGIYKNVEGCVQVLYNHFEVLQCK